MVYILWFDGANSVSSKFAGKFIVVDGPDGCGKSTQVNLLTSWIEKQGAEVVGFRDPGTTVIGEAIRDILLGTQYAGMGDNVEVLLYMAARAQLWKEEIAPALVEGKCVVMDRWLSSTCAYQGKAGGFGIEKVIKLANDCLERSWPDITIILDVDLETSSGRLNRELDRMELKGDQYHQLVRHGYLDLEKILKKHATPEKKTGLYKVINAAQEIEQVHESIKEIISEHI